MDEVAIKVSFITLFYLQSAMRARKYQVVLSLLRKQRDSNKLCERNDLKQNLLHTLSINKPEHTEVQIKVSF